MLNIVALPTMPPSLRSLAHLLPRFNQIKQFLLRMHVAFRVNMFDMSFNRTFRNHQRVSHIGHRSAFRQKPKHLSLARRKLIFPRQVSRHVIHRQLPHRKRTLSLLVFHRRRSRLCTRVFPNTALNRSIGIDLAKSLLQINEEWKHHDAGANQQQTRTRYIYHSVDKARAEKATDEKAQLYNSTKYAKRFARKAQPSSGNTRENRIEQHFNIECCRASKQARAPPY